MTKETNVIVEFLKNIGIFLIIVGMLFLFLVLLAKSGVLSPELVLDEMQLDSLHQQYGILDVPEGYELLFGSVDDLNRLFAIAPEENPERMIFFYLLGTNDTKVLSKQGLELMARNFDQFEALEHSDTTLVINGQDYLFDLNYGIFAEQLIPMIQLLGALHTENNTLIIMVLTSDIEIDDAELEKILGSIRLD